MKNGAKLLVSALCVGLALSMSNVYAVEDFSFDLDAAINNVDKTTGETKSETSENATPATKSIYNSVDAKSYLTETDNLYYKDALVQSMIKKYRAKNYVGCIQEAQSKIKLESPNPVAMYYMALAYTQIGDVNAALELYDGILRLNPSETLQECVVRGRDCLTGGPACPNIGVEGGDMDDAVNEYKSESVLLNLNLDTAQTGAASPVVAENIISAESPIAGLVEEENEVKKNSADEISRVPTNDEVMKAVKTLQDAGIAVTFQPGQLNNMLNTNPEMAQIQMMMGGNSQNNGFDMLPYMMMQSKDNNQYNPQMVQAMMMNYMIPNLSSDNKD